MIKVTKILEKIKQEGGTEEPKEPPPKPAFKEALRPPVSDKPPVKKAEDEALKRKVFQLEEEKRALEKKLRQERENARRKAEVPQREEEIVKPSEIHIPIEPSAAGKPGGAEAFYGKALKTIRKNFELLELKEDMNLGEFLELSKECIALSKKDPSSLLQQAGRAVPYIQLINSPLNTCIYATAIGSALKYDDSQLEEIAIAALLHDIGLIAQLHSVKNLLEYPKTLQETHKEIIKNHIDGPFLQGLRDKGLDENIITAILQHHERFDGSGYPRHLKGDEISDYARILAVVESLEAMCHPRPYQKRKSFHEALKEIALGRKEAYDSRVTKALIEKIGIYPVGTMVELDTGEIARVEKVNERYPLCPLVRVESKYSRDGRLQEPYHIDLAEHPSIYIKREISGETAKPEGGKTKEALPPKNMLAKAPWNKIAFYIFMALLGILALLLLLKF
ncbi:MAG: HD domain-containing protein [Candidatus Omnitrophica bacterium]|nr:HD domain-containing protein [Candidatus Omnitrophota bacterium]